MSYFYCPKFVDEDRDVIVFVGRNETHYRRPDGSVIICRHSYRR